MTDFFAHINGNEGNKKKLLTALQKGTFGKALCFQGADSIALSHFAKAFARALLVKDVPALIEKDIESFNHPDFIEMRPVGKLGLHAIEAVREFCDEVYIAPYEAKHKVMIIHEAERMLPSSANALLKTLEEPAQGVVIILLTSALEEILPTIRSRVQPLNFEGESQDKEERALELIEQLMAKRLSYVELKSYVNTLDTALKQKKETFEENASDRLKKPFKETDLTARQKGELEKQVDGLTALDSIREGRSFLLSILYFFRDLHVIYHGGQESFLVLRHLAPKMFDVATAKEPIALEKVEGAVKEALLALERSTPLSSCIENLFLKLSLV